MDETGSSCASYPQHKRIRTNQDRVHAQDRETQSRCRINGGESDFTNMFLTQTSAADYEALCRLDVLGLKDYPVGG